MYRAFQVLPVIEAVPGKLECLDFHEEKVYVGTSDGSLLLYHVDRRETAEGVVSYKAQLEVKRPTGKRGIEKVRVFAELQHLLVLCDGAVSVHDSDTLEQVGVVPNSKGASTFCSNVRGATHRLCVATKKKIILYEFVNKYVPYKELLMTDAPALQLEWDGHHICIGNKKEYLLMHDETGHVNELFQIEKTPPHIKLVALEELLLANENLGIISGFSGLATKGTIHWSQPPLAVATSHPYVIALLSRCIEVHNFFDQRKLQTIPFVQGTRLIDNGHRVLVASPSKVCCLDPIPFEFQIKDLLKAKRVDEALGLLDRTTDSADIDKLDKIKSLRADAGFVLFADLRFTEAMEHFAMSNVDPRELLSFFSNLLPSNYTYVSKRATEAKASIRQFVDSALQQKLKGSDEDTIQQYVDKAKNCMLTFLEMKRDPHKIAQLQLQEVMDTVLLKLYVDQGSPVLEKFLEAPNHCLLEDCEVYLVEHKRYHPLALLYCHKGLVRKALDVWQRLGTGEYVEEGHLGIDETVAFLSRYEEPDLIWIFSRWVLEKDCEKGLKIFTTKRHTRLPPSDVIAILERYDARLIEGYLEFLIYEDDNEDEALHTKLALHYIATALSLLPSSSLLEETERRSDRLEDVRSKLLRFIDDSNLFDVHRALSKAHGTPLFEECVKLYCKIGLHPEALKILVFDLADLSKAEAYCQSIHAQENSDGIWFQLLQILLFPEEGNDTQLNEAAVRLINSMASVLDPIKVLDVLPVDLPISLLRSYFEKIIPKSVHEMRDAQVIKNLSKMENIQSKVELIQMRGAYTCIRSDRTCPVCNKRIADRHIFVRYPNGTVVHYNCFQPK